MNPFNDWMAEVADDELLVDESEQGLEREARGNLWSFSISPEQAQALTTADLMEFVSAIVEARRQQILEMSGERQAMTFYCWYDEQASQLRFSLVSGSHGRLPFGVRIKECNDLDSIAQRFLASPYHAGIPLSEFVPELQGTAQGGLAVAPEALPVWTKRLP